MKQGRNDPCPCGSGKKFKRCCQDKHETRSAIPSLASTKLSPPPAEINQLVTLFNTGFNVELESRARLLVEQYPDSGIAWKILGAAIRVQGKNALQTMQKAAKLLPDDAEVHSNLGTVLQDIGQFEDAVTSYRRALKIKPDFAEAHNNLGVTLKDLGQLEEATVSYGRALEIKPDYAEASINLGNVQKDLGRSVDAVDSYRRTLKIKPDNAEVHFILGNTLKGLGLLDDAATVYRRALEIKPDYAEANINLGSTLKDLGRLNDAVANYRRALKIKPDYAEAHSNLGNALGGLGLHNEAVASYHRALEIKPDYLEAHSNLGNALGNLGRSAEAVASCRRALEINPCYAEAYINLGNALKDFGRLAEAAANYRRALEIKPDCKFTKGMLLHTNMHCCNWEEFEEAVQELLRCIDKGKLVSVPFPLLAIPSTPKQQKRCAEMFIQEKHPGISLSSNANNRYSHDKIRLGYFSADFFNHATAYLMAELFERHDRGRFEVLGFSFGDAPNDGMHKRVSTAVDRFIEVSSLSNQEIADLARNLEIDIAIDLKGFTGGSRTGIFALHPAPIQVNYLGYPGTMGAPYIDYLIADPTLIPVEHQQHYTEKIAYLPGTYQVNDSHRQISERQFTRSEAGLPDKGFVFCCFNSTFKITPALFDIWMQLLKQVEASVLWLFDGNAQAVQNLRNEAVKRGIAPERIVFAPRMDLPDHLARHRLADLFLDTFFCNAHTTASDALWAGLPLITCLGNAFSGRVAASLLNAIGLPELITHSHEEYKDLALELATNPAKLSSIRQQLAKNRISHPLFNTALFTRYLEEAFTHMWQRHQTSLLPDHIYVRTNQ